METLLLTILITGILLTLALPDKYSFKLLLTNMSNKLKSNKHNSLFDDRFIDAKVYYYKEFKKIPCIAFVNHIDTGRIFTIIQSGNYGPVKSVYQRNYYNWQTEKLAFSRCIFRLDDNMVVQLGDEWCEIFHAPEQNEKAFSMLEAFKCHKAAQKEEDYEINIISMSSVGLDLKTLAIKPTNLDLNLYYNDDFMAIDTIIREKLSKENDKGIVLLHGLPGTGKTTYLRYLIGCLQKKVLFVSPGVAKNLMNPEFMDLLLDNPNAVLIIEDAENIIMDRRFSSQSSVSNLLNISDGLLSDCLNVQIICTFNSAVNTIDEALMRKGRLIARYEFGKLETHKAQKLSDYLGLSQQIIEPMTLAEISNPSETFYQPEKTAVIGFRRESIMAN